jgi:hypothetical protein
MKNVLFIFFSLVAILASCKKDNSSSNPSKVLVSDACQLVSTSEAATITGESYTQTETKENTVIGSKTCDFSNADDGLFQIVLTQTAAINGAGLKTAKEYYDSMKANFPDHEMITGIGDEAFIDNTNGFLYILYTNDYYINICIRQKGLPSDPGRWTTAQKKTKKIAAGTTAITNLKKIINK